MDYKMKKRLTLLKLVKAVILQLTIVSLLQNPFLDQAFAADNDKKSSDITAKDIFTLADGALNFYGKYLGQKQQMIQQQISAANNQKLMNQMSPNCKKPDGTPCYATSGKFFPECSLPASMSMMPQNVCSNATPDPSQISSMITYEAISESWSNYYEQSMNRASNAAAPTGLRCLEDKQKALDSQITEMSNSLQRLKDRLNQDKQIFRDNNKKLLEDMNAANAELFGTNKGDLKNKTTDFAKFFSQSCQSVIGKDVLKSASKDGLNGIFQNLTTVNKAAGDFNLNKASIENDIRNETNKIAETIAKNGVGDFLTNGYIAQNNENFKTFGAISDQLVKQKKEFETAKARIDKTLSEVGYTPPALDKSFSVDLEDFMAGSNEFFKKKYINDCVTGADKGIAIPVDDVLKSLQQKSTGSQGTARNDYRVALKKILDSDAMIEDKMQEIKALEGSFPDITLTYKDSTQKRITETPYGLFMKTISKCEQRFSQDDTFTAGGAKGTTSVSYQKKVDRAKSALQELKNLSDGFSSKITQSILSQVLDCGGSTPKSGNCNETSLDTSKSNFCIASGAQCANEIQGCYAEANSQVQTRKTKMENLAKAFNTNVASMIARSNALYEQQKSAVTNMTKLIQSRFPGTNFNIPEDMFVKMPELKKDTYGVEMAADGNLASFLDGADSMPNKIDKLKEMFKLQKDEVDNSIKDYIALQERAMNDQKAKWDKLAGQCKNFINQSSAEIAKMNAEGQKRQAEEDKNVAKFCKKYNSISQNPVGGCSKAKDLAEISDSISTRITGSASTLAEQYASACDGFMNEKNNSADRDCSELEGKDKALCNQQVKAALGKNKKTKEPKLSEFCKGETSDKDFIANVVKKYFPNNAKESLKDIETLDDVIAKIAEKNIVDNDFFSDIKDYVSKVKPEGGAVCLKIKTRIGDSTSADDKKSAEELKTILVDDLSDLNSAEDPRSDSSKVAELKKIGQQMNGACDSQSNSALSKNAPGLFDLPSGFDQKVLGTAR